MPDAPAHPAADAVSVLHEVFGYSAFRGLQAEVVDHVVGGGDALVLMPTGGGKSLCYQVPAIQRHRAGRGVNSRSGAAYSSTRRPERISRSMRRA